MPKKQSPKTKGKSNRNDACFNPFDFSKHHKKKTPKLRTVNENQLRALQIPVTSDALQNKICDSCRLRINKLVKEKDQDEIVCKCVISREFLIHSICLGYC